MTRRSVVAGRFESFFDVWGSGLLAELENNEQRPHDALGGIPQATYWIINAENSIYELFA